MRGILEVKHLTVEVPGKRILNDVSFALEQGSITALVGPNGAGKTTLMRCIVALDPIWQGAISLNGINVVDTPRVMHRQVGYLADDFGLYDALTVAQCLEHTGLARRMTRDVYEARLTQVVRDTQLSDLLPVRAGALSKGQRQRVGLALALLHDPPLLILDEPASGLDPGARHLLGETLKALRASGKTILVSSHILAELEHYATHMLLLEAGRLKRFVTVGQSHARMQARLLLRVSEQVEHAEAFLRQYPGVHRVELTQTGLLFEWDGPESAQTALLRASLDAGVAVIGLERVKESMAQVYLQEVTQA